MTNRLGPRLALICHWSLVICHWSFVIFVLSKEGACLLPDPRHFRPQTVENRNSRPLPLRAPERPRGWACGESGSSPCRESYSRHTRNRHSDSAFSQEGSSSV